MEIHDEHLEESERIEDLEEENERLRSVLLRMTEKYEGILRVIGIEQNSDLIKAARKLLD